MRQTSLERAQEYFPSSVHTKRRPFFPKCHILLVTSRWLQTQVCTNTTFGVNTKFFFVLYIFQQMYLKTTENLLFQSKKLLINNFLCVTDKKLTRDSMMEDNCSILSFCFPFSRNLLPLLQKVVKNSFNFYSS